MLEKMAKKKKEPNYCLTAKQTNSKHTTRSMTAAHEDKYFPARLNVPLYHEFSEEEANVMQTKLYIDEERHDLKFWNTSINKKKMFDSALYDMKNYAGFEGVGGRIGDKNKEAESNDCWIIDQSYAELQSGICKISHIYAKLHYIFPDIDECSSNAHSCGVNAVCNNTVGSYVCACKAGYSGDGRTCTGKPFWSFSKGDLEEREYCQWLP